MKFLIIIKWIWKHFKRKHFSSLPHNFLSPIPILHSQTVVMSYLVQFSFDNFLAHSSLWQTMKVVWKFLLVISSIIKIVLCLNCIYCTVLFFCSWQCPVQCQSTLMYITSVSQHHDYFSSLCTGLGPYLHFKLWGKWTYSVEWFAF